MKTTHTPGPWSVHENENDFHGLTVQSSFGLIVRLPDANDEENKANARLIALAPEMRDELQDVAQGLAFMFGALGHRLSAGDKRTIGQKLARADILLSKL